MKYSATKILAVVAMVVVVGVAAYWYWSPFLAVYALKSAAERKDADAFNARIDYPRLRESVKGQLQGFLSAEVARSGGAGRDSNTAGAALGALFGVRPDTTLPSRSP